MIYRRHQLGLTLVELMIALALGALLLLGAVNVFLTNSQSSRVESALSQVQQSGRAAVEFLSRDIRRAGYQGCDSINGTVSMAANALQPEALRAYTANGGSLSPAAAGLAVDVVSSVARAGTSVLVVEYAESLGDDLIPVGGNFSASLGAINAETITLDGAANGECQIAGGDLVLFANCASAHVFVVSSATGCGTSNDVTITTIQNTGLGATEEFFYGPDTEISVYQHMIWYVADTGRVRNGDPVYALYRLRGAFALADGNADRAEEMIEGVEFLRIEVGERVAGRLRYAPPDSTDIDWANNDIEALRFALLVQSFDLVADSEDSASYQLLSGNVGATGTISHSGGRVVRRVYTSSQIVRNTAYGI